MTINAAFINPPLGFTNLFVESFSALSSTISANFSRFVEWASRTEAKAIEQKQGATWECLDRVADGPGFIYQFRLKAEYDPRGDVNNHKQAAFTSKLLEIFPAIEPELNQLFLLDPQKMDQNRKDNAEIIAMKLIQSLGYQYRSDNTGHYLYLPDKEALLARFEKLRETHPHLRALNIISSEGIASDMDFVKAYIAGYDALLSIGTEFVHDHIFHVIPTIKLMLMDPDYDDGKWIIVEMTKKAYQRIMTTKKALEKEMPGFDPEQIKRIQAQLPKIETALGAVVDTFWAASTTAQMEGIYSDKEHFDTHHCTFVEILDQSHYNGFAQKKFDDVIDTKVLKDVWKQMEALEKQYNNSIPPHQQYFSALTY